MYMENLFPNLMGIVTITLILSKLFKPGLCEELCDIYSSSLNCQHLREINLNIDDTIDPCKDFYGYACNNWWLEHSSSHYENVRGMLHYQMNLKLIPVLDTEDPKTMPLRILSDTIIYYKSCLRAKGTNVFKSFLEIIKPGENLEWPLVQELQAYQRGDMNFSTSDWPAERFDYVALLGKLRNYGFQEMIIDLDFFHSIPLIQRPIPEPITPFISKLLKRLGFPQETADEHAKRINDTLNYWDSLNSPRYAVPELPCLELKKRFPLIKTYLENIDIFKCADNETVRLRNEDYFKILLEQQLSSEEKRNLCDYIMIRLLHYLHERSTYTFSKLDCVQETRSKLDLGASILYYGYIYRPEESHSNADIQILFRKARDYMIRDNEQVHSGGVESVNQYFLEQIKLFINHIILNVGNMPRNMSPLYMDKLLADLPALSLTNYYQNNIDLLKQLARLDIQKTKKTHDLSLPHLHDKNDIPYYDSNSESLILPFVNLQPPIYHHSFDPIFKWSLLASFFTTVLQWNSPRPVPRYVYKTFNIRIAYQAYLEEHKKQLQPTFTNIPWKRVFFLNYAQYFCSRNEPTDPSNSTWFYEYTRLDKNLVNEAFQCNHYPREIFHP